MAILHFIFSPDSLPNNKILPFTKFKAFAHDKLNVAEMNISVSSRRENIVGKGKNAGFLHFFFFFFFFFIFPQCLQNPSFLWP